MFEYKPEVFSKISLFPSLIVPAGYSKFEDARILEIVSSVSFLDSTSDLCKRIWISSFSPPVTVTEPTPFILWILCFISLSIK